MSLEERDVIDRSLTQGLIDGLESGELVKESDLEEGAIRKAIELTREKSTTGRVSRSVAEVVPRGKAREGTRRVLAAGALIAVITIIAVTSSLGSSNQGEIKASVKPSPGAVISALPRTGETAAPSPGETPTPSPANQPSPNPQGNSGPKGNKTPPRTTAPPSVSVPSPVPGTNQNLGTNGNTPAPTSPQTFDQSDSTPNGDTQRADKISDYEHGGAAPRNDVYNDGAGNLLPSTGDIYTIR